MRPVAVNPKVPPHWWFQRSPTSARLRTSIWLMYAKVPSHLKEPLLKELRQLRLRSAFGNFPGLLIICSAIVALFVFIKGHAIIDLFRDMIPSGVSDAKLITVGLILIGISTAFVLLLLLRHDYRECDYQECVYCVQCDAVDRFDAGVCPIRHTRLFEKASFFYTTYKDEQKVIERWGLHPSKVG